MENRHVSAFFMIKYFVTLKDEYEIIYSLKDRYSIKFLCKIMSVNRSGYYRWLARKDKLNRYEQDRKILTGLL